MIGDYKATQTPVKVYVNPKTNLPIGNIQEYVSENKIPTTQTPPTPITTKTGMLNLEA